MNIIENFRIELQKRLPWLAISEKAPSENTSQTSEATQAQAT